jgi:hypothetical protein
LLDCCAIVPIAGRRRDGTIKAAMISAPPPGSLPMKIGLGWHAAVIEVLLRMLDALSDAEPAGYLPPAGGNGPR